MKKQRHVTERGIPIAAEDKFLIFSFGNGKSLCPNSNDADHLGDMIRELHESLGEIVPVFDLRGMDGYYNDIDTFIHSVGGSKPYVLLGKREIDEGWETSLTIEGLVPIRTKGRAVRQTEFLGVSQFDCDADEYFHDAGTHKSYEEAIDAAYEAQLDDLKDLVSSIHTHSLMIEFVMSTARDRVEFTPYHGQAVHEVETSSNNVIVARPAVIAKSTGAIFSEEISEFERLINHPDTKERHLQKYLEEHPR